MFTIIAIQKSRDLWFTVSPRETETEGARRTGVSKKQQAMSEVVKFC